MKQLLLFVTIFLAIAFKAQIEVKTESSEKVIAIIDSTQNISKYKKSSQFLGLIGTKIYAYPLNPKYDYSYSSFDILYQTPVKFKNARGITYKPGEYRRLDKSEYESLVSKKYLIVEDVDFIVGEKVKPEDWDRENKFSPSQGKIKLYLKDYESGNKFILENGYFTLESYLSVIYYEYLKKKYLRKSVLNNELAKYTIKSIKDVVREPDSNIDENDIFEVVSIDIVQSNSTTSKIPDIKFILKNSNSVYKEVYDDHVFSLSIKAFPLKSDYEKFVKEYTEYQRKKDSENEKKWAKEDEEREQQINAEIAIMVKKYGKNLGEKIYFIDLEPGMSFEMMLDAMNKTYIKQESHTTSKDSKGKWDIYTYKTATGKYYTIMLLNWKIIDVSETTL